MSDWRVVLVIAGRDVRRSVHVILRYNCLCKFEQDKFDLIWMTYIADLSDYIHKTD